MTMKRGGLWRAAPFLHTLGMVNETQFAGTGTISEFLCVNLSQDRTVFLTFFPSYFLTFRPSHLAYP